MGVCLSTTCFHHHLLSLAVAAMSFVANSTLAAPDTYFGIYNELSKYNVHLNIFERLWASWYAYMQNAVLATGIMSLGMHEARPSQSFHRRTTSDLALPPNGCLLRHGYR